MSSSKYLMVLCLAVAAAGAYPARAQTLDDCLIGPDAPDFAVGPSSDSLHPPSQPAAAPHTGTHGQGLYGGKTSYLSHLGVFMGDPESHPHNFQVLLEVAFADPDAKASYLADRAEHSDTLYTAVPPRFDQMDLLDPESGGGALRTLAGSTIVRGHFEQGGTPILDDVGLEVERVVYFREFLLDGARLETQHYRLFGRGEDIFLSHLLSAPPDFDQILSVAIKAEEIPTEAIAQDLEARLAEGLYLELPGRENTVATRLRSGDTLTCSLHLGTRALPIDVELRVGDERYCEAGEFSALVINAFNDPQRCAG